MIYSLFFDQYGNILKVMVYSCDDPTMFTVMSFIRLLKYNMSLP